MLLSAPRTAAPRVALYDDSRAAEPATYGPGVERVEASLSSAGLSVDRLSRDALNAPDPALERYAALVFPGGYASPGYTAHVLPSAKAQVLRYVADGGTVMGICAGAFLCSERTVWHGVTYGAESGYTLPLLQGAAVGPIPGLADYPNWALTRLRTVSGAAHDIWYAAGPALYADTPGTEVLATYEAPGLPEHGAPALTRSRYGQGNVVLWGPHPEGNPHLPPDAVPSEMASYAGALLRETLEPRSF